MTRRRIARSLILAFLLLGVSSVGWSIAGLPPVRFILRYGPWPSCEPTGRTVWAEGVEFVEIGPGISRRGSSFLGKGVGFWDRLCWALGLPWARQSNMSNEMPVHWVEFRHGFWIARTELTNEQYERFDPDHSRVVGSLGDDHPVGNVSWDEVSKYCNWLAERSGYPIRLPTEAEWECACRAGSTSEYCFGNSEEELPKYAWFGGNSPFASQPVGMALPNDWGIFDMHGNVLEWCLDSWRDSYSGASSEGSAQRASGDEEYICRGGSWKLPARSCRSAARESFPSFFYIGYLGFRPAFVLTD